MRKEFLLTEEEKHRRRQQRLEKNRKTTSESSISFSASNFQGSPSPFDEIDRVSLVFQKNNQ